MALLDRYLKEIAMWLPQKQATDIVAELRADIQSEIDDRRDTLGRDLTTEEEEAILTRWGHPMLVASRYQPQESLIGPVLLPTYYFVLKMVSAVYLLPWFLVWLGINIFGHTWGLETSPSLKPLLVQALGLFALITAGFAAIERVQRRDRKFETWTARELTVPGKKRNWRDIPRSESGIELAIGLALLAWWSGLAGSPAIHDLGGVIRVTWTPLERGYYFAVLVLIGLNLAVSVVNFLHPRWTVRRLGVQTGIDIAGLVVVGLLLRTTIMEPGPGFDDNLENALRLARWINGGWTISLATTAVILISRIVIAIRRLGRVNEIGPAAVGLALALVAILAG
jgi:hypothetical protein